MSRRRRTATVATGLFLALVSFGTALVLANLDLATAAAWANILALFVALAALGVALVPLLTRPSAPPPGAAASGRDHFTVGGDATFTINNERD